jgi:alcohol dehydrogenase class IV
MVHAIEAYSCVHPNKNPVSLTLAREALRLLSANIRAVIADGGNREARGAMLLGSMLAGQAFANSPVGAVHALAYPLGGIYHLPHGLTNALVLPHVMRFNAADPGCAKAYAEIAPDILPSLAALSPADRVEALIAEIVTLSADVGLPARLGDVGIPRDAVPRLAADAMKQQRLLGNNPRVVSEADALAIYGAAA